VATTGEETLLDEQRRRVQAGVAGISAGILTIAGGGLAAYVYRDIPSVPVLGALREQLEPGAQPPGLKARQALWYHDNAIELILVGVVLAFAAAMIGLVLSHLFRSVKARRPETPNAIVYAAIAGAVLVGVSGVVQAIGVVVDAAAFADAAPAQQTSDAAREVLQSPVVVAAGLLRLLGVFSLGIGFIYLALNGMRVGLLTRFMGVLGIIVGVLFIVPIGSSLPIVQAYWLVGLGVLFLGHWPSRSGLPPAWITGEAQPWPTQQELREARIAKQAGGGDGEAAPRSRFGRRERAEPPETPAPELPAQRKPHPSSKKKKGKRR
jgi:hypothetical protein